MQIKTEEDILEELKNGEHHWLLVLARKIDVKNHKFVFYLSDSYERLTEVMARVPVVDVTLKDSDTRGHDIPDDAVWVDQSSSEEEEEEEENFEKEDTSNTIQAYYVGKSLFDTASTNHEALMAEGSRGWKLAMLQKYQMIQAKIKKNDEPVNDKHEKDQKTMLAAKASAAAVIGGGVAVGGTSATITGIGFTASGITANSVAAGIMASEAVASGGGVAAGGLTATLQSMGAAGVMANPIGMGILAAGALVGGVTYLTLHKMKQIRKEQNEQKAEVVKIVDGNNEYEKVQTEEIEERTCPAWVIISIQRTEDNEAQLKFTHKSCDHQMDAERGYLEWSSNAVARALFNSQGSLIKSEMNDINDDGLEAALALHYDFVVSQGVVEGFLSNRNQIATEDTPLLKAEEPYS